MISLYSCHINKHNVQKKVQFQSYSNTTQIYTFSNRLDMYLRRIRHCNLKVIKQKMKEKTESNEFSNIFLQKIK